MNTEPHDAVAIAREKVARCRAQSDVAALASALEIYARSTLQAGDVGGAATSLEEAGGIWARLDRVEQAGSCLLLAASSHRLAGQPEAAARALAAGRATALPVRLLDGFEVEACEQALANGRAEEAWHGFSRFLERAAGKLEPPVRAQMLQRCAAAAVACKRFREGATDLLAAGRIYLEGRQHADAEACALAAAGVLAEVDAPAAECIVQEVGTCVPRDGTAAARRGLVGGRVARQAGALAIAVERFDQARQGALDARDPVSYLAAAIEAADSAEASGDRARAYATLATGWATLGDLLGRDATRAAFEPRLRACLERWGPDEFKRVKGEYEETQRARKART
jgi:hypothetical protein